MRKSVLVLVLFSLLTGCVSFTQPGTSEPAATATPSLEERIDALEADLSALRIDVSSLQLSSESFVTQEELDAAVAEAMREFARANPGKWEEIVASGELTVIRWWPCEAGTCFELKDGEGRLWYALCTEPEVPPPDPGTVCKIVGDWLWCGDGKQQLLRLHPPGFATPTPGVATATPVVVTATSPPKPTSVPATTTPVVVTATPKPTEPPTSVPPTEKPPTSVPPTEKPPTDACSCIEGTGYTNFPPRSPAVVEGNMAKLQFADKDCPRPVLYKETGSDGFENYKVVLPKGWSLVVVGEKAIIHEDGGVELRFDNQPFIVLDGPWSGGFAVRGAYRVYPTEWRWHALECVLPIHERLSGKTVTPIINP